LWTGALLVALIVGVSLALRLPDLGSRPFHTDEANNAYLLQEWLGGHFRYRAHDHHGPLLFHLSGGWMQLLGVTSVARMEAPTLRSLSLGAGVLLALSPLLFLRWLGWRRAAFAGLLLSCAAPFVYYNGLFLHESLLLLLVACFTAAFWHVRESGGLLLSGAVGVFAGLALATKETAAPVMLLLALVAWPGATPPARRQAMCAAIALLAALVVTTTLYSSFWAHPREAFGLFRAVGPQLARGTGSEHAYPWFQYLTWYLAPSPLGLPWAGLLLTAGAILGAVQFFRESLVRTLALWSGTQILFFSALSYKTPWLALVWLFPAALLTACLLDGLLTRGRTVGSLVAAATVALLVTESMSRCVKNSVEPGNVFAYSPTSRDIDRLEAELKLAAAASKQSNDVLIQVVARDYWPLPWILRRYPNTGYWSDVPPLEKDAILLLGPEFAADAAVGTKDLKSYSIRPGALIFLRPPLSR
jgi:uncharacterized protein (TIGR03663 family)